jgi:hypothetical protein
MWILFTCTDASVLSLCLCHMCNVADDFKPQSVDPTRPGHLKITEEEAVHVSLPVGQVLKGKGCGGCLYVL